MRRMVSLAVAAGVAAACSPATEVVRTDSVDVVPSTTETPASSPPSSPPSTTGAPAGIPIETPPDRDEPVPIDDGIRVGTLDNGLTYYVRRNTNPGGWLELRLGVDAGSVNEQPDQSGVAHFLEHMMFNGTESYPENELIDVLRGFGSQFGADVNAYTSYDETVYELTVPARDATVAVAVDVLSEWLSAATIDPAEVERERGVVLDEWRVRTQTGGGRAFDAIADLFLSGTSYDGRKPIGEREAISAMEADTLRRFYEDWYRPDNAAIVAVGDIDVDDMVELIEAEFGDALPRGEPAEPDRTFPPVSDPAARVHADAEQGSVIVELTLPMPAVPADAGSPLGTRALRMLMLDELLFDVLATRLQHDVAGGVAPFDSAHVDSNSHVRLLDAPSVLVEGRSDAVRDSLAAVVTELRRAELHGISQDELGEAAARMEADLKTAHAGRNSRQDADFADSYVEHFLTGYPVPDADRAYELGTKLLGEVTVGQLNWRLRERLNGSAPHLLIVGPDDADLPTEREVLDTVERLLTAEPEPRSPAEPVPEALMQRPAPVDEVGVGSVVGSDQFIPFVDPTTFEFPNGATVTWNDTSIEDGVVRFAARSPGGCAALDADGAANAMLAPAIVMASGVGPLDQARLDRFLAGTDVVVAAEIGPYHDEVYGEVATADAEILFQLLHLYFTEPRVDQHAFDAELSSWEPLVSRPQSDPQLAGLDALVDLRYGGHPCFTFVPSGEQWEALDPAVVERVWRERTSNASDWDFVLSGDLDGVDVEELARSYIGSLPGTGVDDDPGDITPPAPVEPATAELAIGTGDTGSVAMFFSAPGPTFYPEARVLADLASEILTDRMTKQLREELGETYSPFAWVALDYEPGLVAGTFVDVSGAPERLPAIAELVHATLAELRRDGPTDAEMTAAIAVLREQYDLFYNEEIIDELLATLTPPTRGLAWLEHRSVILDSLEAADVGAFLADHVPTDGYVQVIVRPG